MLTVNKQELMPGVWLRSVHTEKFKSSYLSLTFLPPLSRETAAENALIPHVLRRGSQGHPDMESLSAALDSLYGGAIEPVIRKKGETQCVGFLASFMDDAYSLDGTPILEGACALLGELLLHPKLEDGVLCQEYVEGERQNLIDMIRSERNDKRSYAVGRLRELMCAEEAFGVDRLGDEASAQAITAQSLTQRWRKLLSESEISLYYCGSAPEERVEQALREALSDLPRSQERPCAPCDVRLNAEAEPRRVEESLDVTQGKLALGFRTGGITAWEEEYPALLVFNALYGAGVMSKLFLNVREKLSLCYYVSSSLDRMKGVLWVSSGIEFDQAARAQEEILAQLEAIRQGQVEPWELEAARRSLLSARESGLDSQSRLEEYWLSQAAAGLDETPQEQAARLEAVTLEQVVSVAQRLSLDTVYFLKGRDE